MLSALLLIPRNSSINETAGQTNAIAPPVSKKRSVYLLAEAARGRGGPRKGKREGRRGREGGRNEFRSLVAGEGSAKQLGRERHRKSDVSSARALE